MARPRRKAWHSVDGRVYHVCRSCPAGRAIHEKNRQEGRADKPICGECAFLIRENECDPTP